jgi:uracil-DNA glycosylase
MSAADFLPQSRGLPTLRRAAEGCRGCELWKDATQTVFGAGASHAQLMLVGEQPGDQEDIRGAPFVGPAGEVLDRALKEVGIDPGAIYITNAVKHFKWRPRGKRRLHQTPRPGEVEACKPWLEAEIEAVEPDALLALGATAGRAIFGPSVRVLRDRGSLLDTPLAPIGSITLHPSAILRAREQERDEAYTSLVNDLEMMVRKLKAASHRASDR